MMKMLSLIVLLCTSGLVSAQEAKTNSDAPPPPFKAVSQPDAPARVVSAALKWALPDDRRGVEVYVVVVNASQKAIRTYTTRRQSSNDGAKGCLGPPRLSSNGLLPGEKAGTSTWQRAPDANSPATVWVDFVEFTDGTRWGVDECQTGEWLDGSDAGARAQRDQLLKILREEGAATVKTFIYSNYHKRIDEDAWKRSERPLLPIWPPTGHSPRWDDGFTSGARSLVERVIEAERKWGPDEIEHELSRPIGPTEKKAP